MDRRQMQQTILMVSQPTTGGVATHVIDLSQGLAARGWSVTVACPSDGWLRERLNTRSIDAIGLPMGREIRPVADLLSFVRLFRLCRRMRPTVLHLHASKAGFLGRVAGRVARIPVIIYTPNCWSFQLAEGWKKRLYVTLERFASRFCTMTIAVSQREVDDAVSLGVLSPSRIRVVHNAVRPARDGALPEPVDDLVRDAAPLILAVGRPDEQKGHAYLVEAMRAVAASEPSARLIVAGGGPLIEELRAKAAALGLSDAVHFVGELDDVGPLYFRADVFVLSSIWGEGLPYTILEAMTAGLAVVSTDVGGCAEIVQDGATGLIVPPRNADALAEGLLTLLSDPRRSAEMGALGRRRAQTDYYTLEGLVESVESLYLELLGETRATAPARAGEASGT